jgi:hypothetical protein
VRRPLPAARRPLPQPNPSPVIHLAEQHAGAPAGFAAALSENGAEFPMELVGSIMRLVEAFAAASKPAPAPAAPAAGQYRVPRNEQEAQFPGLSMANVKTEQGYVKRALLLLLLLLLLRYSAAPASTALPPESAVEAA